MSSAKSKKHFFVHANTTAIGVPRTGQAMVCSSTMSCKSGQHHKYTFGISTTDTWGRNSQYCVLQTRFLRKPPVQAGRIAAMLHHVVQKNTAVVLPGEHNLYVSLYQGPLCKNRSMILAGQASVRAVNKGTPQDHCAMRYCEISYSPDYHHTTCGAAHCVG